jgi:hypothetical protein
MPPKTPEHTADVRKPTGPDLVGELRVVRESVEELYLLLDHVWRNRNELYDLLSPDAEEGAEGHDRQIVACCHCDTLLPTLATAVREGWTDFQLDNGRDWNYLAICADCQTRKAQHDQLQPTIAPLAANPRKTTRSDDIPETLACARCDVDSPASLAAALQEGWVALCRDDGIGWNYLGICPECQAQENAAANQGVSQTEDQKRLFA